MFSLLDRIPQPAALCDQASGVYLAVNDGFASTFGFSRAEVVGKSSRDLGVWARDEERREAETLLAEQGMVAGMEAAMRRKDGSSLSALCSMSRIRNGEREYALLLVADVSERRADQEALRASEARLNAFFENSAVSMAVSTADGRWLRANRTFQLLLGYDEEELKGMTYPEIIHPAYREAAVAEIQALLDGDLDHFWMELRLLPRDGRLVWVDVFVSPLRDEAGKITSLAGIALDITQRKLAERGLRESEARFHSFLDNIPAPTWIADERDRLVFVNKRYEELYAPRPARTAGGPAPSVPGDGLPGAYWTQIRRSIDEDRAVEEEVASPMPTGELRRWRRIVFPLRTAEGKRFVGGVAIDVTGLRRLQREAEEARDAAERANLAKSEFLANMSHEIRTPLNGILGMAELALQADPSPEAARYLRLIKQSGWSLQEIIGDILDFAKIESSGVVLERKPFSLRAALGEALEPIGCLAAEKGLAFEVDLSPETPDLVVGDETRLRQVLVNLAGNAVKFTDKGSVRVRAERIGFAGWPSPSARLLFTVGDTGVGIEQDKLDAIFESFSQAHADHGKYGGTGLGLAIAKRIVDAMNGRIWAESRPGRGSVFSVAVWFELASAASRPSPALPPPKPPAGGYGLKVLLVEDNAVNRLLVEELLKKRGCGVRSATNAAEALKALAEERFDLTLMDIRMPGMSGDEATRLIRTSPPPGVPRDVPIVALTAHALAGDKERFLAAGMDDCLTKPLSPESLDRLLERVARGKAGS